MRSPRPKSARVSLDDGRMCPHILGPHLVEMMVMAPAVEYGH